MSAHEKACTGCGVVKSLDDFHRFRRNKDGRKHTCRGCVSEQKRRYYEENRDKLLEQKRRYYEENRDKVAERDRHYYEENRDKILERKRRYHEENRGYLNTKTRNYQMNYQHTSELFLSKPKGTPWTPEEEAFLLTNDGRTNYQKAIELGRTHKSTVNRLYRLRKAQAQ